MFFDGKGLGQVDVAAVEELFEQFPPEADDASEPNSPRVSLGQRLMKALRRETTSHAPELHPCGDDMASYFT